MLQKLLLLCRCNSGLFSLVIVASGVFLAFIGPARAACMALGLVTASVVLLVLDTKQNGGSPGVFKAFLINFGAAFLSLVTLVP